MNADYLQVIRYRLQRRFRRLHSTGFGLFHFALQQFWAFLRENSILRGSLDVLDVRALSVKSEVDGLLSGNQSIAFRTEQENVLASYLVVKHCAESQDLRAEQNIGAIYGLPSGKRQLDEWVECFKDIFLEPLYDFLDESLDERALILSLLVRYKRRSEWFEREYLYKIWSEDTQHGEKSLAVDLYKYLFDQGLNFQIEPTSASGEADLVASQIGDEPLIADAKIFCPDRGKGKPYLIGAFNQVYTYTLDFNEPYGFLVIFNTSDVSLHFVLSEKSASAPLVTHNNKTIFFVVIDVYPNNPSASKKGQLRSVEITESDLVNRISGEATQKPSLAAPDQSD